MRPAGSGRRAVRRIRASSSRSTYWLSTADPAATSPVPRTAWTNSASENRPGGSASRNPAAVVTLTSSVIRGFVSSRRSDETVGRATAARDIGGMLSRAGSFSLTGPGAPR